VLGIARKWPCRRIAMCLVGLLVLACNAFSQEIDDPALEPDPLDDGSGLYYYYFSETIPLTVSTETLGIYFDFESDVWDAWGLVADDEDLAALDWRVFPSGLEVVYLRRGLTTEEVLEKVVDLDDAPHVTYTSPVFSRTGDRETFLMETFTASFLPDVTADEIEALNQENNVEVVRIREFEDDYPSRYTLRPIDKNCLELLDTANRYYESGLTRYAEPNFFQPDVALDGGCFLGRVSSPPSSPRVGQHGGDMLLFCLVLAVLTAARKRRVTAIATCLVALPLFSATAFSQQISDGAMQTAGTDVSEDLYYYYFAEPIALSVSTEKVGIYFEPDSDASDTQAVVDAQRDLLELDEREFRSGLRIAHLRSGLTTEQVLDIVVALKDAARAGSRTASGEVMSQLGGIASG